MEAKEILRKKFKEDRKALSEKERAIRSEKIASESMRFLNAYRAIRHIHLFLPIKKLYEINTVLLLPSLFGAGYEVYGSITDRLGHKLQTVKITKDTVFIEDGMGIPIPKKPIYASNESIDLVFVPLLGVDDAGNRLGYGMGFYDRFFGQLRPKVLKVGLSYFDTVKSIPVAEHDVALDACVFPHGSVIFNK
ncbi:5-formyltetrahydrofolate cyclo-ligase [Cyclobacterium xiamenense]|uniref:5-formyltetrahydrofolate cyclo-ligase n=1 Tax=Cyclobacterium xiamenense TaxID=1297121 RepID=A0A1H6W672_9BACT|nr:5-formyltetrahydrofolate cyclo-ligase [Cyclobacterium xiamenense]SEJ12468.1 5-formyltetrahydrofolate cyclo-ligase [Cyclobacterium xiamenense]